MTLTDFILARIAEREAVARGALGDVIDTEGKTYGSWWAAGDAVMTDAPGVYLWVARQDPGIGDTAVAAHIALWDPAAALARCAVDRQIVEFADEVTVMGDRIESEWGSSTPAEDAGDVLLRLLASLDADHPDYDESWKP